MDIAVARNEVDQDTLFARAKAGDQAAWKTLFETCYPKIIRVVRRRLTSPTMRSLYDSADFAHDVWKSLAAKSDRFHFASLQALVAFLSQAVERKVIDEYRRQNALKNSRTKQRPLLNGASPSSEPCSSDPSPSQYAQARESWQRIQDGRTETERTILRLKHDNHSTEAIADTVGWHPRKVQRFLRDLQDSLDHEGDPR
jgi:RNA polymerase sigma factor (sigma-70 family)